MGPYSEKTEALLNCAGMLFAKHGFNAVGIDRIISESGVARMTLYRHFPTKNHLILEILKKRRIEIRAEIEAFIPAEGTPIDRLNGLFSWYDSCIRGEDFYGCIFTRAASEFFMECDEIVEVAMEQKTDLYNFIATALGNLHNERLTQSILALIDGAVIMATLNRRKQAIQDAFWATCELVKSSSRSVRSSGRDLGRVRSQRRSMKAASSRV